MAVFVQFSGVGNTLTGRFDLGVLVAYLPFGTFLKMVGRGVI